MVNREVNGAPRRKGAAAASEETMGQRIARLRVAFGYTQEQLGEMVGATKSAVSQWETGSSKNIKLATFLRLLDALHTDANYLIWGDKRRPPSSDPGGDASP
jgi:transcriptional regulator with XRE-family HTH domain